MEISRPFLLTTETEHIHKILEGIVHLHAQCVLYDGTLATFLPPFSYSKMLEYWQERLAQVTGGTRQIIVQLATVSSRTAQYQPKQTFERDAQDAPNPVITINDQRYEVAGVVSLWMPGLETGPFRAEVHKLFTSPNHRRKGIARSVMRKLEEAARAGDVWSMMLDTTVGTDADSVYPRLGYIRLGVVNDYGIHPLTTELVDEVWYWKDLRKSAPL